MPSEDEANKPSVIIPKFARRSSVGGVTTKAERCRGRLGKEVRVGSAS